MTNKNIYIIGGLIIVLIIAGIFFFGNRNFLGEKESAQVPADSTDLRGDLPAPKEGGTAEIIFTDDGFSPNPLTIKAGETVTFVNRGSLALWPASAMHPTHLVYPGSDIKKCGTPEQSKIFDACRGLQPGESWSFQMNEKGSWNYHNHLGPTKFGKIIVE